MSRPKHQTVNSLVLNSEPDIINEYHNDVDKYDDDDEVNDSKRLQRRSAEHITTPSEKSKEELTRTSNSKL